MPFGLFTSIARGVYCRRFLQAPIVTTSVNYYSSSEEATDRDEYVFEDIRKRISKYKQQLKYHSAASYISRGLNTSISNLNQSMSSVMQKRTARADSAPLNSVAANPAFVTIEILSNGTTHLGPCVLIKTPLQVYIFNCPEGASRFLSALRVKSFNVLDIFITRGTWSNIGGISSILLSKEELSPPMRLHGAVNIKHFLECIRPFQDSDFGSIKFQGQVEECPYNLGSYEDAGVKVTYIPLSTSFGMEGEKISKASTVDVAYLLELKEPARRIDPLKLISLKIPSGPLIGRLKGGESVTLADGRIIQPGEVWKEEENLDKRHFLIAECADECRLDALLENSVVRKFYGSSATKSLNYVIHLSKQELIETEKYKKWISELGEGCQHIVVNGSGPVIPHTEGVYRHQRVLRQLLPGAFPNLYPEDWFGTITQNSELCTRNGSLEYAAPLQKFFMRQGGNEAPIIIDLRASQLTIDNPFIRTEEEQKNMLLKIEEFTKVAAAHSIDSCEFPCISFLGTSSAVPTKYRNVSSYLIETNSTSAFLVDVGEGTYGQIRVLFGDNRCRKTLTNLHAIFITHAHQDHVNGLYTIIEKRKEAFDELGIPYIPLVLICNKHVMKPLKTYSMCFVDLEPFIEFVDVINMENEKKENSGSSKGLREYSTQKTLPFRDLIPLLPEKLYSKEKWGLDKAVAVQVHHTRLANGFVFFIGKRKLVFSGDTKPCQLLVDQGMGADILIHEATFEDGIEKEAERKKHSTMGQAVEIGRKMKAKHVILTHFSARYPKIPPLPSYLDEAGNVSVAMDNMRVRFDHLDIIPKLIPLYRDLFIEELFQLDLRKEQKGFRMNNETSCNATEDVTGDTLPETRTPIKQKSKNTHNTNEDYDYLKMKRRRTEQKAWSRPIGRKVCGDISMDSD